MAANTYKAKPVSDVSQLADLLAYLREELESLEVSLANSLPSKLDELHAAPAKVFTGLIVLADGTDWNPGSGQGVYAYYASAWNKLG